MKTVGYGDNQPLDMGQFASVLYDTKYNKVVYHESHDEAGNAEQGDVQDQHQANALPAVTGVEIALDPVIRRAVAELDHRFRVLGFGTVELGTAPQHGFDAARLRAMRVFRGLAFGVVLAVNRDPFLGDHARAQP